MLRLESSYLLFLLNSQMPGTGNQDPM